MKIVHIEDFFHPDAGYQINILSKYQAKSGDSVTIICAVIEDIPVRLKSFFGIDNISERDREFEQKNGVKIIRVKTFGYYSGRAVYKLNIISLVRRIKPDLLYVHGNDSFAGVLFTLLRRIFKHPIIFDNHMLEMATKNKYNKYYRFFYKKIISPIIIREELNVIRLVDSDFVVKHLGIPVEQAPVIPLGTDSLLFQPNQQIKNEFRRRNDIPEDSFVVLYMGKLTIDKGVMLLANAFLHKVEINKEFVIVIVGNASSDYSVEFRKKMEESENRVLFFPTQKYTDLAPFYQMADVSVFPRHCSLSFFDAQSAALPVVLEKNEINDQRLKYNNGLIFRSGESDDLRKKVISLAKMNDIEFDKLRQNAINFIKDSGSDYSDILKIYTDVFKRTIDTYRKKGNR